jgi:hypothetical protein
VLRTIPKPPLSFSVGIEVAPGDKVARFKVTNITPAVGVESESAHRWGTELVFKCDKRTFWLVNHRYEMESDISGETAKMTQEIMAEKPSTVLNTMLTMVDQTHRYPMNVHVSDSATWEELVQVWHVAAETDTDPSIFARCPKIAEVSDFKNASGNDTLNIDDNSRIFAHLIVQARSSPPQPQLSLPGLVV